MATDPRIDTYIARAAPFARPILAHLRSVVHDACPDAEETLKWGTPAFVYQGKLLCIAAGFKAHCAFVLWARENQDAAAASSTTSDGSLRRITRVKDLPPRHTLRALVTAAAQRIAQPPPAARPARAKKPPIRVPADLEAALALDAKARAVFEKMPSSHRREYIEWVTEAKTAPTRERRLATALEWLAEGKPLNWKYQR